MKTDTSMARKCRPLVIVLLLAACITLALAVGPPASAYDPLVATYAWGPGVPNYNSEATVHAGTIDTSGLVFGDFLGYSATQPNAGCYGDFGVSTGWDDKNTMSALWIGHPNTNGDSLDGRFVIVGVFGDWIPKVSSGWWDLGCQANRVVVFLAQDHGPYPAEGLECLVYGSNTLWGEVGSQAILEDLYLDGWRPHNPAEDVNGNGWCSDDIAAVYRLPGTYRYIKLSAYDLRVETGFWEPEVDAVATFAPVTLTMDVNGCGNTDPSETDHTYAMDTVVPISAEPCLGWEFTTWTGDVLDANDPTTHVVMDSDKTVIANFEEVPYTLTMLVDGCGHTDPGEGGSYTHGSGTVVPISAEPCAGWSFVEWTGDVANRYSASTTVTMDSDKTVTAVFSEITYTLTVMVDGCGETEPGIGSHIFGEGAVVPLSATACDDWEFVAWSGDVGNATSPTTSVVMDSSKTVTAHFAPPYTLTLLVTGCGITDPPVGGYTHAPNTVVPIEATACPGWEFVNWTGAVGNTTSPSTGVLMNSDKIVIANFEEAPQPLGVQLAVILDGSSSINADEWATQIDGLYRAIVGSSPAAIPRDGSVELTVIQFAGTEATTEVHPTVIDAGSWSTVASAVQGIVKRNGITPISLGIEKAVEEITSSPQFGLAGRQVINLSSDVGAYTLLLGKAAAEAARDNARVAGIDVICAEGIGDIRGNDIDWLLESIVWPQPGTLAPPFTPGWVYVAEYPSAFEEAMAEKVKPGEAAYPLHVGSTSGGSVIEPGEGFFLYPAGSVVDLVAVADPGWVFDFWTGNVADTFSASTTVTMDEYRLLTANFAPAYSLDVSSTTGGSVVVPGEGIFDYKAGTVVNLTAVVEESGWQFSGWTGNVADPLFLSTTVTMDQDQAVMANFSEIPTYVLSVSSGAGGSVTEPGEGDFTCNECALVPLIATPYTGWDFAGWTGNVADYTSATTTITMCQDESVTASFSEIPRYVLSVASGTGGSVTTPGEGDFIYNLGWAVTLVATPDPGWAFAGWTGDVADPSAPVTSITMDQDQSVTASFSKIYTLSMEVSGIGVTDPAAGDHDYVAGTAVSISATPGAGWSFYRWTGDVASPYALSTTVTMNSDKTVTASFFETAIAKTLVMQVSGSGATSPPTGYWLFPYGVTVEISAVPSAGWLFTNWTTNVANPLSLTTTITMTQNQVVTAYFAAVGPGGVVPTPPPSPSPTPTPGPTRTPSRTPGLTPTPAVTPTPGPFPTPPPTPTPSPTLTPQPTYPPAPTPTPVPTPMPTPTPSPTPGEGSPSVPWWLVVVAIASVVGVGFLFFRLRSQVQGGPPPA